MLKENLKFYIALGIIFILAISLITILWGKPQFDKYIVKKQVEAQRMIIDGLVEFISANGGIILIDSNNKNVTVININLLQELKTK